MKKRISILLTAVFAVSACGTVSYTSSSNQKYNDGIYSSPEHVDKEKLELAKQETQQLSEKTRNSEIYLFDNNAGIAQKENQNTVIIPQEKSITINLTGPVTIGNAYWNPWYYDWRLGFRYDPWYAYNWWYFDSWYYDPWRYDPWYHDYWHYDYWHWGYHHHWYHHHYWHPHHYCGWYGGWYSWGGPTHIHGGSRRDIYYGHRSSTGFSGSTVRHRGSSSNSLGESRVPAGNRQGIGTSSSMSRRSSSYGSSVSRSTSTGGRTYSSSSRRVSRSGIVSTSRPSGQTSGRPSGNVSSHSSQGTFNTGSGLSGGRRAVQSYRGNSSSGSTSSMTRSSAYSGQSNYRRPAGAGSSFNANPSYNRSSSYRNSSTSGQSFNRSSSFNSSTSSYGRSSSSMSTRSSSTSSSGISRSSGGSSSSGGGSSSVRRR